MSKPICVEHMMEMQCSLTGATVHYPLAQYIYMGDIWECPRGDCKHEVFLRAFTPVVEGFMPQYHAAKEEATVKMWNL